ncbi:O-antigen polymerase protein [Pseudomonas sp. Os17]|uniref:O-antigen ligase family protein n=1 Tax=Pseudomonas TaxID=286 RepID=UPI0005FCA744|nr:MULTISPECIES: O-antigen ligase family protein [Pseudomonas]BAQ72505.1 O-antigen polymerase protein [Pseudomonas sp. Os17]
MSYEPLRTLLSRPGQALLALGLFVQLSGFLFNNDGSRQATQVYLLLFVPALILLIAERFALSWWRQPSALILLALLGWVVLRSCFDDSWKAPGYLLKVALLILLYVFVVGQLVRKGVIEIPLALAVLLACCFAWLTLIVQFVVLDKPLAYEVLRSTGRLRELGWHGFADFSHPIPAGLYYGIFAVLLLSVLVERELKAWAWLPVLVGLAGLLVYVLLTFSRGAWFSTLAGSLTLLVLSPQRRARVLLLIGALLILLMMAVFWSRVEHEWFLGTSQRGPIWLNWLARLPEFWALGKGAGVNLVYRYPWGDVVYYAHSLYLQLWFEYGIVGFALFVLLLGSVLRKAWRLRADPAARVALATLVFALVAMVSEVSTVFSRPNLSWIVLWLPIGLIMGLRSPVEESSTT